MLQSDGDGVYVSISGPVATIVFDQKGRRNALRLKTWLALPRLIAEAEQRPDVELLVLRGAHGVFGSGNDIVEFGAVRGDPGAAKTFGAAMAKAMQAVEAASKPVLVAIEGVCYGASVALALAGDLRVAATNATFAVTPAKLGVIYLRSDLHRLVAAVGTGPSKLLIYSAEPVSAARAQQIGLVDEVLSAETFETELSRLIKTILSGSQFTLRQTKNMMRRLGGAPTPEETDESLALFVEATQGVDFKEGVEAFVEKRSPRFC